MCIRVCLDMEKYAWKREHILGKYFKYHSQSMKYKMFAFVLESEL